MKRSFPILLLLILFVSFAGYAQSVKSVKGIVKDTLGNAMQSVRVRLASPSDSLAVATNETGAFTITGVKASTFTITVSFLGFETYIKQFTFAPNSNVLDVGTLKIKEAPNELETVTIQGVIPVIVKEDTVEFSAAAYPVRQGDAVEEIVKKLPGVTVDGEGNVTTEGKPITRIRVNGKDFFGDDVATAIQNLPAEVVQNLQIVDDYGEEARLTGIKTDEPQKILNINIRPDKNKGYFANASVGKGNEDRYSGNLRANVMSGDRQVSLESNLGNVNSRGGGGGNGINNTKSVALSYRDKWSKKVSVNGSYNFFTRDNNTIGTTFSQNFYPTFTRQDDQRSNSNNENFNHRFEWNVEYQIDSMNFLRVNPNLSYNSSRGNNIGLTNTTIRNTSSLLDNSTSNNNTTPNAGGFFNFNHRFHKKGRNLNINGNLNYSDADVDRDTRNLYTNTDSLGVVTTQLQNQFIGTSNYNRRNGFRVSFSEPLTKTSFLQLSYGWNKSHTESQRNVNDVSAFGVPSFNPFLSNNYQYDFTTNRYGLTYRVVKPKYNYNVGVAAQPAELTGYDISRKIATQVETFNWIPNARFNYKFSQKNQLTVSYDGRTNQPSFTQLQPITDNSNLQNVIVGNPNLKPEYSNNLQAQFNMSDMTKGYNSFANLQYSQFNNKIVTTRSIIPDSVKQITSYINTDGFYSVRGNYLFSKSFQKNKYRITYNGGANYNNNITFNNSVRNSSRNLILNQGLRFQLFLQDIIDTEFGFNYSTNNTNYSLVTSEDRRSNQYRFNVRGRNFFFKDLTLGYNFSKTYNTGLTGDLNRNPTTLNLNTEYRFLKGGAARIRLEAFDIFNQNTGISRIVSDSQIIDSQYNQLARYFLLSFTYQIRKFAGGVNPANRQNQGGNYNNGRPGGNFGGGYR